MRSTRVDGVGGWIDRHIGARIHRRPAGAVIETAAFDHLATFETVHLVLIQSRDEALDFEVAEFKFIFCHTITEQLECE